MRFTEPDMRPPQEARLLLPRALRPGSSPCGNFILKGSAQASRKGQALAP